MYRHVLGCCAGLLLALLLSGCQATGGKLNETMDELVIRGAGVFNTLAVIKHDYERGRLMRARALVLEMDKKNRDYAEAQQLLKEKIEPARRRVFLHYLRSARQHEKQHHWSKALWAYDQAVAVTIEPAVMLQKRTEMQHKLRQLRLQTLIQQRRKEDRDVLAYSSAYEPPSGIQLQDKIYARMREHYNDMLDDRAVLAFREARRYLRKQLPEMALLEIESYLRLRPESKQGSRLLKEIKQAMPAFIRVPPVPGRSVAPAIVRQRPVPVQEVTAEQVRSALKASQWLKARQLAQLYRRHDGKDADTLLAQVQKQLQATAASLFARGSTAFRQEKLDLAIQYWSDTVALVPEKSEYIEALRRAQQLKERLTLLQE